MRVRGVHAGRGDRVFIVTTDESGRMEKDRMEVDPDTFEPLDASPVPRSEPRKELNNGFYPNGKRRA